MNDRVMDLLMDRMSRGDRRDERRGVRGSGRRDRMGETDERRDSRDYSDGYEDGYDAALRESRDGRNGRDNRDGHESPLRLSKHDLREWKRNLENDDGSKGPHYEMEEVRKAAEKHNIEFDEFTEAEFCMTVNMFYSDYCQAAKKYVEHDKMLDFFVDMSKKFLEDVDGPEPWTKLMLYYHCIVNG